MTNGVDGNFFCSNHNYFNPLLHGRFLFLYIASLRKTDMCRINTHSMMSQYTFYIPDIDIHVWHHFVTWLGWEWFYLSVKHSFFKSFFYIIIGTAIQYRLNGVLCIYTCYAKGSFSTREIFTNLFWLSTTKVILELICATMKCVYSFCPTLKFKPSPWSWCEV